MSDSSLGSLIKKALEYFDEKNTENKLYLNNTKSIENLKLNLIYDYKLKKDKSLDAPKNQLSIKEPDMMEKNLITLNHQILRDYLNLDYVCQHKMNYFLL